MAGKKKKEKKTKQLDREPTFSIQDREKIKMLAGCGLRDEEIAAFFNKSEATLKRHCRDELSNGRIVAKASVQQTAFRVAQSGRCPAMTMFWLKTRCGWREKDNEKEDDGFDASKATTEELKRMRAKLKKKAKYN